MKPEIAARQANLLRTLGLETAEERAASVKRAIALYEQVFAFAEEIVTDHPEIVD